MKAHTTGGDCRLDACERVDDRIELEKTKRGGCAVVRAQEVTRQLDNGCIDGDGTCAVDEERVREYTGAVAER